MRVSGFNVDSFSTDWIELPVVDSTNTYARTLAHYPENKMVVIVARRQTAGRGQRGNSFFSNVEGGLWMTVVCPIDDLSSHFRYNRAMIMAAYDTLAGAGRPAVETSDTLDAQQHPFLAIKWPNDLLWGERKIGGILLETTPNGQHLIIGIGLNVNIAANAFPPSLRDKATSVLIETGHTLDLYLLRREVLEAFQRNLTIDEQTVHAAYCRRLYGVGKTVKADDVVGVLQHVLPDGRLVLFAGGRIEHVLSGPVHFLRNGGAEQ